MRLFLLLLLIAGLGLPLAARQEGPAGVYGFRSFGSDHGLSNTAVRAVAQDGEGFLWVGTEDGLFRLEGNQFRRFGEEDGLFTPRIMDAGLSAAHPVGLWVETERGLMLWSGRRFLKPSEFGMPGLDGRPGTPLPQGGVIFSDAPSQTRYLARGQEGFQPITGLPWGTGMTAASLSRDGRTLVIGLGLDLWVRRDGVWNEGGPPLRLSQEASGVLVDRAGGIWIRSANHLWKLGPHRRLVEVAAARPLSAVGVGTLSEDGEGRIWTSTAEGLVWVGPGGGGFLGEAEGLPRGGTGILTVDREGTIWVGGDGLHKLLGEGRWTAWTRRQGLPGDIVWAVHRASDGRLWAGTTAGLAVMEQGRWLPIPGTAQRQVMSLASDASGRLWAGILPGGRREPVELWMCEPGQRTLRRVNPAGMPRGAGVLGLHAQGGQALWVAATRAGLWRMDLEAPGFPVERVVPTGWPKDFGVQVVYGDGRGGLWVAGGPWVGHFDGRSWAVIGPEGGLHARDEVLALAPASDGTAWLIYFATKGVDRVRREGGRLVMADRFGKGHILAQYPAYSLLAERDGSLWVGSSRGLLRWDGTRVERFGRNAGLPGEDCSQNALWRDPDGDLFVGLSVGLARGETGAGRRAQMPPPAVIVAAEDAQGRSLMAPGAHRVPWQDRTLAFRYAASGSRWTEDTTFQVRLAGLERDWRTTALPEARYTELSPGRYRFEVRTFTFMGEPGEPAGFDLEILAPWWRKPWALALEAALLALGVWGFFRWRTAHLRRRNAQLEAVVQERTEALELANAALREASLTDPLTGLHNRRYLAATMPEEEVRLRRVFRNYLDRGESPLGHNEDLVMLMLDLDHFKRVNDTYGHTAGDAVLQQAAKALRTVSRSSDTLVRWGGEEFLLVAKRTERDRADLIAQNLCAAIRNHTFTLADGRTLHCTVSVGYAACPILDHYPEAFSWEDALQAADQCLYAAKRAGRDGWMGVHTPGPLDPAEIGPRFRIDIEGLAAEGKVVLRSSFG